MTSFGITCALCHSTVDDSLTAGVGHRLDGWANTSLDVGKIAALSPFFDDATKAEFSLWGPGKYDPRHHAFDGTNIIPLNSPSLPVDIPAIYGLKGVGFETYTADGPISYWNSYVGVGQMGGQGTFSDPRIGLFIRQKPDLVTPKLRALLFYQLSLEAPPPPPDSFDRDAARRGKRLFNDEAGCASCHQGPTFTDVLDGPWWRLPRLHDPAEVGTDPAYAARSATGKYPDDAPTRALATRAVLPRRERPRSPRGGQSLQPAVRPESVGGAEGGSCGVSEVAVVGVSAIWKSAHGGSCREIANSPTSCSGPQSPCNERRPCGAKRGAPFAATRERHF